MKERSKRFISAAFLAVWLLVGGTPLLYAEDYSLAWMDEAAGSFSYGAEDTQSGNICAGATTEEIAVGTGGQEGTTATDSGNGEKEDRRVGFFEIGASFVHFIDGSDHYSTFNPAPILKYGININEDWSASAFLSLSQTASSHSYDNFSDKFNPTIENRYRLWRQRLGGLGLEYTLIDTKPEGERNNFKIRANLGVSYVAYLAFDEDGMTTDYSMRGRTNNLDVGATGQYFLNKLLSINTQAILGLGRTIKLKVRGHKTLLDFEYWDDDVPPPYVKFNSSYVMMAVTLAGHF